MDIKILKVTKKPKRQILHSKAMQIKAGKKETKRPDLSHFPMILQMKSEPFIYSI